MAKAPHQAALQEFFRWERQSWVEVVADLTTDEKAYFMPVESLRSYFTGNGSRKLNKILSEVFESEDSPVDPEVILRGHTAVFCILLRISKGKFIEDFAYFEELSDQRLPFDPTHPPPHFPEDIDDPSFLQRFCETQWMYCVPVFDSHMLHKYFGRRRLLPITHKERIEGGGTVERYRIKLYGPHNKLIPAGSDTQINNTDPNTFMLKRYASKEEYRQEVKNFSNSKHSESIIRFHGSYTHGSDYNILLEFADKGSLEQYFRTQTPPSRGGDIIKFWDSLFQLIKAIKAIHSFSSGHQDVRPASVLVLSYGAESAFHWQFKLADFGVGYSASKATSGGEDESRGPQTYAAPKCHNSQSEDGQRHKRSSKTTQAEDIWSLGCIYSEAAVWIADGYSGVIEYRRQRIAEIEKIPDFTGGDSFHDGERALKTVLNTHREIELRLRRSDNITKDVLDSMVEEMLWEEDRPGAKALWRRAEGLLSRARQKLSSSTTEGSAIRPLSNTNRSRTYPAPPPPPLSQSPPHPPPERPLPERPRVSTSRSNSAQRPNSAQRQSPANVEMWRTLVRVPSRDLASSVYGGEARTNPESISEHDTDVASSTSGWQTGGNRDSLASPITPPHTSPHTSSHFDFPRQAPPEVKRGPPQSQRSSSLQRPGRRPYRQSPMNNNAELSDGILGEPSSAQLYAQYLQGSVTASPAESNGARTAASDSARAFDRGIQPVPGVFSNPMTSQTLQPSPSTYNTSTPNQIPEPTLTANTIPTMPNHTVQSNKIADELHLPQNPQKRFQGLSLFPNRANKSLPVTSIVESPPRKDSHTIEQPVTRSDSYLNTSVVDLSTKQPNTSRSLDNSFGNSSIYQDRPATRSDSISTRSISTVPTSQYGSYQSLGHLSFAAILEWKTAHKKSKKNVRVPPVRGADLLDKCNDRDHVFIIDDGISMREQWPQVKTAFEALSYVLKPMAPDGIELYFTNSYDTWRRHNTTELVDILEKKGLSGETDISHRLRMQLQDYIVNANSSLRIASKKSKKIRPVSFYVLTNGNWKEKSDLTTALKEIADYLIDTGMVKGHLTIQFVSFGQNAEGLHRINEAANIEFGLDLVDTTPSTGDVLKMLCGPLDKNYFQGGGTSSRAASSASTLILPLTTLPPIELA